MLTMTNMYLSVILKIVIANPHCQQHGELPFEELSHYSIT